jgi:hypothetical protein
MVVPDVIGEIVGWRAWRVIGPDRQPLLKSAVWDYIWRPGRWNVARCDLRNHDPKTQVPMEGCSCGFYAGRTREHLLHMAYNQYGAHDTVVIGEVAFVGKVIPGTQGWRAQKARPLRLYLPFERWRLAEGLEATYGCEVRLSNTWTAEPLVPDVIPDELEGV